MDEAVEIEETLTKPINRVCRVRLLGCIMKTGLATYLMLIMRARCVASNTLMNRGVARDVAQQSVCIACAKLAVTPSRNQGVKAGPGGSVSARL